MGGLCEEEQDQDAQKDKKRYLSRLSKIRRNTTILTIQEDSITITIRTTILVLHHQALN